MQFNSGLVFLMLLVAELVWTEENLWRIENRDKILYVV